MVSSLNCKTPLAKLATKHFFLCGLLLGIGQPGLTSGFANKAQTTGDSLHVKRLIAMSAGGAVAYAAVVTGLNRYWYAHYDRVPFHVFDDGAEWLQMDKVGHIYTTYFESRWAMHAFRWCGIPQPQAAAYGALTGFVMQGTIEVLDGFSEKWGASPTDLLCNAAGAGLVIGQQLAWSEQRLCLKFSAHPKKYSTDLTPRTTELFGNTLPQRILKDYNGQTYWLSINPASFVQQRPVWLPQWLNIAVGYGAEGLLGGTENTWQDDNHVVIRNDVHRVRQYYLSLDVDLSRIPTRSAFLKTVCELLNILKVPAPALEWRNNGRIGFHVLYF